MSEYNDISLEKLGRMHQLFSDTLERLDRWELISMIQLLAGDIGELRQYQTELDREQQVVEKRQLVARVKSGDAKALDVLAHQQSIGMKEALAALEVIRSANVTQKKQMS